MKHSLGLAALLLFGCEGSSSGSGGSASGAGGQGGSPVSSTGGQGGMAQTSSSSGGGEGAAGGGAVLSDVHLVGRYDVEATAPRATWSGASALATMMGPSAAVRLSAPAGLWFEIVIDGQSVGRFETSAGEVTYPLADALSRGPHTVEISRRNEGFFGIHEFLGFEPASAIVPSPSPYNVRLEFIGDSLTCGYGIEGASANCSFSGATESAYSSYALVAARELSAAAHLICYSGKGVHQNYGGNTVEMMPELYPRTLTDSPMPVWTPEQFAAQVVVINLGTNDFSAALDESAFVEDYVALLSTARTRHPQAYLLGITWAHWGASKEALVEDAFAGLADSNSGTLRFSIDSADGLGCDYHTNTVTNQKLGLLLANTLQERLGF